LVAPLFLRGRRFFSEHQQRRVQCGTTREWARFSARPRPSADLERKIIPPSGTLCDPFDRGPRAARGCVQTRRATVPTEEGSQKTFLNCFEPEIGRRRLIERNNICFCLFKWRLVSNWGLRMRKIGDVNGCHVDRSSCDCALRNSLSAIKQAHDRLHLLGGMCTTGTVLASQIELCDVLLVEISGIRSSLAKDLRYTRRAPQQTSCHVELNA
jgi:hypothetical protein